MKITGINLKTSHWALIAACIVLLIAGISTYLRSDALLSPEGDAFLVHHLTDRPYISKILCPDQADATDYQARPMSHFFENIDAHIFYLFYLMGKPIFISICTKIILIFLSGVIWFYATGYAGIHPGMATLILTFFWLNPNVFFAGTLYRDAKIAATFFLTLAIFYSFRFISQESPARLRDFAVIFVLALLACLSEPQGFAFVLILSGIALVWAFFTASRNAYMTFASGLGASLTHMVLAAFILPGLIARYAGFHTRNNSLRILANNLQTDLLHHNLVSYLKTGFLMFLDTIRFLFGNVPRVVVAAGIIMILIAVLKLARHRFLIGLCFILFIAGNCVMESAIFIPVPILCHPVYLYGGYYQLPTTVLFFIALLLIGPSLLKSFNIPRIVPAALLVAVICANIIALPYYAKSIPTITLSEEPGKPYKFMGYFIAAPAIRDELIALSKVKPIGPPLPYNAWGASHSDTFWINSDKMLLTTGKIHVEYYICSSRIINFLRSRKGLPYYKIWTEKPEQVNDQKNLRYY